VASERGPSRFCGDGDAFLSLTHANKNRTGTRHADSNTRIRQLPAPLAADEETRSWWLAQLAASFVFASPILSSPSRGMACRSMARNRYVRSAVSTAEIRVSAYLPHSPNYSRGALFLLSHCGLSSALSLLIPLFSFFAVFLTFSYSYRSIRSQLVVRRT
jgi:hypothetical protein